MKKQEFPDPIETEDQLEEALTRPSAALIEYIRRVPSPLVVLGAGGKMGPTLAVMARRAAERAGHRLEIMAVSRFNDSRARAWLEGRGVRTIRCDLLQRAALAELPEAGAVVYMVGLKFGTSDNPSATWAVNTLVPAWALERYPAASWVALSTGNVYPLSLVAKGGSEENDPLTPLGEYGNAAVGRERIIEHYSRSQGTRVAIIRLFYAVEMRYGVLRDLALKVWRDEPIELANGFFNCIWQGDANEMIVRALSLAQSPPSAWNLCRGEIFSVREVATRLGELLGRSPRFRGNEAPNALLGNSSRLIGQLGAPAVPLETMLTWTAEWVRQGGPDLGKPTHFEVRDGQY